MKKQLQQIVYILIALLLVAQFFRPERTNPASDPKLSIRAANGIPPAVLAHLESSCFNCHSNETSWPWYSNITPINYLIVDDVRGGRRHVNFSEWGAQTDAKRSSWLDRISDEVSHKDMPLPKYLLLHPEARLSDADIKLISTWASTESDRFIDTTQADDDDE